MLFSFDHDESGRDAPGTMEFSNSSRTPPLYWIPGPWMGCKKGNTCDWVEASSRALEKLLHSVGMMSEAPSHVWIATLRSGLVVEYTYRTRKKVR